MRLFIFCRAMCAKRCWQMHKEGVISNCVKSVCVLCVTVVIWGNLQNCVKWNAGRVNAIPNCTIWNNLALEEKPSCAHLRCKNITPNLDRKLAIQSYCLVNSNRAHAMSTQFWVWHFFQGEISLIKHESWLNAGLKQENSYRLKIKSKLIVWR